MICSCALDPASISEPSHGEEPQVPCAPGKRERGHRAASADKQGKKDSLSA